MSLRERVTRCTSTPPACDGSVAGSMLRTPCEARQPLIPQVWTALILCAVCMTAVGGVAPAAAAQGSAEQTQRHSTDPVVVVESFLAARNARDPLSASAFFASLLSIQDGERERTVEQVAAIDWLRRLTDTYAIDMLVRPHADGERVTWMERLTPRSVPFRDALAASIRVDVQVEVQDGKIISYDATYPTDTPEAPVREEATGSNAGSPPSPPPWLLFGATCGALAMGLALLRTAHLLLGHLRSGRSATPTRRS
jgi:hypothetical protein